VLLHSIPNVCPLDVLPETFEVRKSLGEHSSGMDVCALTAGVVRDCAHLAVLRVEMQMPVGTVAHTVTAIAQDRGQSPGPPDRPGYVPPHHARGRRARSEL
jgi:hypothetical protein